MMSPCARNTVQCTQLEFLLCKYVIRLMLCAYSLCSILNCFSIFTIFMHWSHGGVDSLESEGGIGEDCHISWNR